MENVIDTIRKFRTAQFTVIVDAVEDYDIDLSWDDDGSVRENLQRGYYVAFCARVRVLHDTLGEVGRDYLGSCIYHSPAEFQDHRSCGKYNRELAAKGKTGRCGSYFADMIGSAIKEARGTIAAAKGIKVRA